VADGVALARKRSVLLVKALEASAPGITAAEKSAKG
jgi:hypothetical protein